MATFRDWVRTESLDSHGTIDQFQGAAIAIDGDEYLDTLLTNNLTREPLLPALGGLPFALDKHVKDDLNNFAANDITPIFVFNGLQLASRDKAIVMREARKAAKDLDEAWSIYDQGRGEEAVNAFGKACNYKTAHIVRWLQLHLYGRGVHVQIAPYTAAAQLVYLVETRMVDGILGSASALAFGADKVITSISWENKTVSWVESKLCQGKLMFTLDGFIDTMLLSGCLPHLLPSFPEIEVEPNQIQAARPFIARANGDVHSLLQQKDEEYCAAYRKARYFIKHPVIMTTQGRFEAKGLPELKMPGDYHDVTGHRLPTEVMYYLSTGLAGPRVLNWSVSKQVLELPPLDGGNSNAYRDLVQNKLTDIRRRSLAVICGQLHRHYQFTALEVSYWFNEETNRISLKDEVQVSPPAQSTFHVKDQTLSDDMTTHPLTTAFGMLSDAGTAKSTVTKRPAHSSGILSSTKELVGNTVFRFLQDTKYANADHTLTPWGRALNVALQEASKNGLLDLCVTGTEAEEAIFMAFELLRMRVLHNQNLFPTPQFSGQPLRGTESDKQNTLLISRIACLGFFRHRQIGYTGPLSRHLLAYHQMAASVRASLRDLLEMNACAMSISGAVDRKTIKKSSMKELASKLPFVQEPDLGLALIVKSYLDEQSNEPSKRQDITRWFNYVLDMEGDLEKAWKLWACVNAGVQSADTIVAQEAVKRSFQDADEWLQKKRATTNGTA
ncbi:hypothetical protein LTR78_000379 [Recurvomyces mirabilis]|uniref:XPG-I domain-containing protein n=1 Tax=Recurvomyces mirabilis TaxID=574656 RepID=A0AAE0WXM7_9PEZI|nr:hypothetical protein LTR78_000379 [Recurvomyces mirabilis]KAK5162034.1 hypothetical protein LTS14_000380 [Recurvomyces mirabilis]